MNKLFQIGDFVFRLKMPESITPPPNFMLFEIEDGDPQFQYEIVVSEELPVMTGKRVALRADLAVYEQNGLESRWIGVKGTPGYYACYQEVAKDRAVVTLAVSRLENLHIDPVFSSLLAMERRQTGLDAFVLHCAYVEYEGEAILFSAPSETGKTTQATLWEKYKGARTVNGDRGLIRKKGGRWVAGGWPVCGSSEICNNEEIPIRAIVMLSQGKEDVVSRLSPMSAFSQVYSQVTINRWNASVSMHMMDLVEQLIREVPVWHLSCTISENAVNTLYGALRLEE